MKQQQIDKYVGLFRKYEKGKKSRRMLTAEQPHSQMKTISRTEDTACFRKSVQEKIKQKYCEPKPSRSPQQSPKPELQSQKNIIHYNIVSKRKYDFSKEDMENKYSSICEKLRAEHIEPLSEVDHRRLPFCMENYDALTPIVEEKKKSTISRESNSKNYRRNDLHILSKPVNLRASKSRSPNRSEQSRMFRPGYELDGSIFHFDGSTKSVTKGQPFFNHIFHHKQKIQEKRPIYELMKTISPIIIKSKAPEESQLHKDIKRKSKYRNFSQMKVNDADKNSSLEKIQEIRKSIDHSHSMPKRVRGSQANLTKKREIFTGWEVDTED